MSNIKPLSLNPHCTILTNVISRTIRHVKTNAFDSEYRAKPPQIWDKSIHLSGNRLKRNDSVIMMSTS